MGKNFSFLDNTFAKQNKFFSLHFGALHRTCPQKKKKKKKKKKKMSAPCRPEWMTSDRATICQDIQTFRISMLRIYCPKTSKMESPKYDIILCTFYWGDCGTKCLEVIFHIYFASKSWGWNTYLYFIHFLSYSKFSQHKCVILIRPKTIKGLLALLVWKSKGSVGRSPPPKKKIWTQTKCSIIHVCAFLGIAEPQNWFNPGGGGCISLGLYLVKVPLWDSS